MENKREIRLPIEEFEAAIKSAKLIASKEIVSRVWIEPGEMVITLVH